MDYKELDGLERQFYEKYASELLASGSLAQISLALERLFSRRAWGDHLRPSKEISSDDEWSPYFHHQSSYLKVRPEDLHAVNYEFPLNHYIQILNLQNLFLLYKGMILAEGKYGLQGGGASITIPFFREICRRTTVETAYDLAVWAKTNRGQNECVPLGGYKASEELSTIDEFKKHYEKIIMVPDRSMERTLGSIRRDGLWISFDCNSCGHHARPFNPLRQLIPDDQKLSDLSSWLKCRECGDRNLICKVVEKSSFENAGVADTHEAIDNFDFELHNRICEGMVTTFTKSGVRDLSQYQLNFAANLVQKKFADGFREQLSEADTSDIRSQLKSLTIFVDHKNKSDEDLMNALKENFTPPR